MKKNLLIFLFLTLIALPASLDLLQPGGFTSHDLTHHILRQIAMDQILAELQLPPRWAGNLNHSYGYPVFIFNYPLPPILGEIFHKIGFNFVDSVKAVLFLSIFGSIIGMFLFLRSLFKPLPAFLGAVFFVYAPIRFIDIYVAAAVGSALSLAILPFVFWSFIKISQSKANYFILIGSALLGALILSHNLTSLIFFPPLLLLSSIQIYNSSERKPLFLKYILTIGIGLGLASFFWLPSIGEKQYIRYDLIMKGFYLNQFPQPIQLLRSAWGYGLSHPDQAGGISYEIGAIQILVILLLILSLIFSKRLRKNYYAYFSLGLFLISIFLILRISQPIWDHLPLLSYVQFPWRFLILSAFASSIAGAIFVDNLSSPKILVPILIILVIYSNRNHWHINQVFDPGERYYLNLKTTSTSFDEDSPIWVRNLLPNEAKTKFSILQGAGEIKETGVKSADVLATALIKKPSLVQFNQIYFPGWQIQVNNQNYPVDYKDLRRGYDLPTFELDPGVYQIESRFNETPVRVWSDLLSIISLAIWSVWLFSLIASRRS